MKSVKNNILQSTTWRMFSNSNITKSQGWCPLGLPRTWGQLKDRVLWSWPGPWPQGCLALAWALASWPRTHWQIAMLAFVLVCQAYLYNTTHVWAFAGITVLFRSTPKSWPNNLYMGLRCPSVSPSVRTYLRPSAKSFSDSDEIW